MVRVLGSYFTFLTRTKSPCTAVFWTGRGLYTMSLGSDSIPTFAVPLYEFVDTKLQLTMSWERQAEMLSETKLLSEFHEARTKAREIYLQQLVKVRAMRAKVPMSMQTAALHAYMRSWLAKFPTLATEFIAVVSSDLKDWATTLPSPFVVSEPFAADVNLRILKYLTKPTELPDIVSWLDWYFDEPKNLEPSLDDLERPPKCLIAEPIVHVKSRTVMSELYVHEWISRTIGANVNDEIGPVRYWLKHSVDSSPNQTLARTMIAWWTARWSDSFFDEVQDAKPMAYNFEAFDSRAKSETDSKKNLWLIEQTFPKFVEHQRGPNTWKRIQKDPAQLADWRAKYERWLKVKHDGATKRIFDTWTESLLKTYDASTVPDVDLFKYLAPRFSDVPHVDVWVNRVESN